MKKLLRKNENSSRIVYEEDRNDSLIKSKIVIYKRLNLPIHKDLKEIPMWAIVLILMFVALLVTILIAAVLTLLNARRPGLHEEDCYRRSCETKLGLKCINSMCQCDSNQYYLKGCKAKKTIGEFCQNYVQECKNELSCYNGKCTCAKGFVWYINGCKQKGTRGDDCSKIECDDSLMLICDVSTKSCDCNLTSRFWSGKTCVLKRGLNERCVETNGCRTNEGLNCIDGLCQCNLTHQYFDSSSSTCNPRKPSGSICVLNIECLGDMTCSGTCGCQNASTHYFNESTLQCTQKTLDNTPCSTSLTCRSDLGLTCNLGNCQCGASYDYWDGTLCTNYKLYSEACSSNSQCKSSQETICSSGQCSCNTTSHYFNSTTNKCELQLNESSICANNIECLGDMVCSSGQCFCSNTTTHYFSQSTLTCTSKTLNNTVCSTSLTCRTDLGLNCVSGRCQCDTTTMAWNGVKCAVPVSCPSTWSTSTGSCFYISSSSDTRTYTAAKSYCSSQGGSLVIFKTSAEYTFFKSIIPGDEFHIGLEKVSGSWLWVDGSPFDTSMWMAGKPGGDPCGRYTSGGIEDKPCVDPKRFVCEKR